MRTGLSSSSQTLPQTMCARLTQFRVSEEQEWKDASSALLKGAPPEQAPRTKTAPRRPCDDEHKAHWISDGRQEHSGKYY